MKLAIIGGGGFRVPLIIRALRSGQYPAITSVSLYDTDQARLQGIKAVIDAMPIRQSQVGSVPVQLQISATLDLRTAVDGAAVVFATIRPGGTEGRVRDERIALRHGVLGQETVGAGGINYALRSIPAMLDIAAVVAQSAPHAWLINFTNPAGMVTQALNSVLPGQVVGICDSPVGLIKRVVAAAGTAQPDLADVDYVGLNHLGWLRALPDPGALERVMSSSERLLSFEEGRLFGQPLLSALGAIPNEYLYYYYNSKSALRSIQSRSVTRGESIAAAQATLYPELAAADASARAYTRWDTARREREEGYLAEARASTEQRDEADLAGGGYEAVALTAMNAILTGTTSTLILNLPNRAPVTALGDAATPACADFADDDVLEGPATLAAGPGGTVARLLPHKRPLSADQSGLMHTLKAVERLTIEAAVERNADAAVAAMTLHPLIGDESTAAKLVHDYAPFSTDAGV